MKKSDKIVVPAECVNVCAEVCKRIGWEHTQIVGADVDLAPVKTRKNKKVMLALSGGLDSAYLLYKLIEKRYSVICVHVNGLNKSCATEEKLQAERIAKKAGAEFICVGFKAPSQKYPDNPFKNQLILSIMLDIGVKEGVTRYAIGSDWETPLANAAVGYTITDSKEVNEGFWNGIKAHFPYAELLMVDGSEKKLQRISYLYEKNVLEDISSCIAAHRFRAHLRDININKYGVRLMRGRCGSCYKCCMEYLLLVDLGLTKADAAYKEHCWDILAESSVSHRPELFNKSLSEKKRMENLRSYGS